MKKLRLLLILFVFHFTSSSDPFSLLGIPTLNPSSFFRTNTDNLVNQNQIRSSKNLRIVAQKQKVIKPSNDINFIQKNDNNTVNEISKKLNEAGISKEEGIGTISRFLLASDSNLQKLTQNEVIFDRTQFSGLQGEEISLLPADKFIQQIKSSANIYMNNLIKSNIISISNDPYELVGLQENQKLKIFGWKAFKALFKNKQNQSLFMSICYPLDEMLAPITSIRNEDCSNNVKF